MTKKLPHLHRWLSRLVLAVSAAALAPLCAADFAEWKYQQSFKVGFVGFNSIRLPLEILDAARIDRGDIRLMDPAGREVPFALQQTEAYTRRTTAVRSFRATLGETHTQLVIECGSEFADTVTLETPARNFLKRARIETSKDGITWQPSDEGIPIFRHSGAEDLSFIFIGGAPFFRVTLDDSRSQPVPFTGAKFGEDSLRVALSAMSARIARRDEFAGETVLTLNLDAAHVPLGRLKISTPERLFTRQVKIGVRELRDDFAEEKIVATGTIYNVAIDGGSPAAHLTVPLDFTALTRELIVHVANGDSPPLAITGVEFSRYNVSLSFDATAAGIYSLLAGNSLVAAPRYDIANIRPKPLGNNSNITHGSYGLVRFDPLTPNPAYRAPEALAGVALAGAALDPAPWRFRKAVRVAAAGVQQLELDLDVLAQAQRGLGDLRLVRDGAQVPYLLERPNLSRSLELAAKPAADPRRPSVSRWEITLPRAGLPLTQLTLTSPTALFRRHLRLFEIITNPGGDKYERRLSGAEWNHTPDDKRPLALTMSSPPATTALVLETDNGDNPPIALGLVTAAHPVARLLFKTDASPLSLYYGHAGAAAPRYDLAIVAGQILAATKEAATLGPEEPARAEGWGAGALAGLRGGVVLWVALALVVIVLLVVVAKLLPKAPA